MLTKLQIFDQNHGLTPLEKCQFCGFLNRRFRCLERLVCYIKRRKSFFLDLFSRSMTWKYRGYKGLQWVTGDDKGLQGWQEVKGGYHGLQGVPKGYKGFQGVTRGDKGLQRVIKDYRNFFLTRTFQDTFSWSILQKNQSWTNLKFFTKTTD